MIQAADVLGSLYDDLKSSVVRTDFDTETLASFSAAGIEPPVREAKFIGALYFFSCKIEKHRIGFTADRVDEIIFVKRQEDAVAIINDLVASKRFEFKAVTKKQMEETPFEMTADDSENRMNFTELKIQRFESGPSQFDINDIDQYVCLTFRSDVYAVVVQQEDTGNDRFFVFELRRLTDRNK
jgi:hypothetical protein